MIAQSALAQANQLESLDRSIVAKMVKCFIEAAQEVIAKTGQTKVEARTQAASIVEHPSIEGDAAGALSFIGDYSGQFIIVFSKAAICEITGNMLYMSKPYASHRDPDVEGAIGEITNQVAGRARMSVSERLGWKASNGIPSVIVGESIRWTIYGQGALILHIPFSTPNFHELYMQVAITSHPSSGGISI